MRASICHVLVPAVLLPLLACQNAAPEATDRLDVASAALDAAHAAAIQDSVRDLTSAIARDLERDGPTGWLAYFVDGPEFFMASDGQLVFPSIDSATSFIRGFAPGVAHMELVWEEMRIDPLFPGAAVLAASYREVITDTAGSESRFQGYFTGVAVHTSTGWRLRDLHWSSPAPTP
jgi:hypothetical protein